QDLLYETWVSYADLVLGTTIEIPTLTGEKQSIRIEPGTPSGEIFRINGKGIPRYGSRKKGDLLVQVHVWVPRKIDRNERQLLEEMRKYKAFIPATKRPEKGFLHRLRKLFTDKSNREE
ncbi:MAG: DnaJ C-terminal domain-containing protein, partial [Bacteroidia bacterium]|nr:molecular chaperone DnaJ [Bacteroidia bacterium]MDW8135073.1 DnaJ C-terminal domain-containing protein [Bacteroidia bacterium]